MRFRRKRKPRVVWLPNTGQPDYSGDNIGANPPYLDTVQTITLGGGRTPTISFPLFQDNPPERWAGSGAVAADVAAWDRSALAEQVRWGYKLRRIVGKLHLQVSTPAGLPAGTTVPVQLCGLRVTAGLIVRRVDENGLSIADATMVSPHHLATIQDPWIWRRAWTLKNAALPGIQAGSDVLSDTDAGSCILACPDSTTDYNSVADGPHIDAKTARVVGPDERVFLCIGYRIPFADNGTPTDWDVAIFFDYRGVASLRANQGNRRNASR